MELEFISFVNPGEAKTRDYRRKVRSHAMHHVRQRQNANRKGDNYQALQPATLTQQASCMPPRSFPLVFPSLDNEIEDGEQEVHAGRSETAEQLEAYPISRTERYIYTIFLHCKSL